jgi:hypothetical protein
VRRSGFLQTVRIPFQEVSAAGGENIQEALFPRSFIKHIESLLFGARGIQIIIPLLYVGLDDGNIHAVLWRLVQEEVGDDGVELCLQGKFVRRYRLLLLIYLVHIETHQPLEVDVGFHGVGRRDRGCRCAGTVRGSAVGSRP